MKRNWDHRTTPQQGKPPSTNSGQSFPQTPPHCALHSHWFIPSPRAQLFAWITVHPEKEQDLRFTEVLLHTNFLNTCKPAGWKILHGHTQVLNDRPIPDLSVLFNAVAVTRQLTWEKNIKYQSSTVTKLWNNITQLLLDLLDPNAVQWKKSCMVSKGLRKGELMVGSSLCPGRQAHCREEHQRVLGRKWDKDYNRS